MLKNLLTTTLLLSCLHAHAAPDWQQLNAWENQYPSSKPIKGSPALLEQAALKITLKTILPKAELALLGKLDVEAPVKKVDGFLLLEKCMPHNCSAEFASVVIDVAQKRLWVGFFTREENRVASRWYGNVDDYAVLPEAIKQGFVARHGD